MEQRSFVLMATTMESLWSFVLLATTMESALLGACSPLLCCWHLLLMGSCSWTMHWCQIKLLIVICVFVFFEVGNSMQINLKITFWCWCLAVLQRSWDDDWLGWFAKIVQSWMVVFGVCNLHVCLCQPHYELQRKCKDVTTMPGILQCVTALGCFASHLVMTTGCVRACKFACVQSPTSKMNFEKPIWWFQK